MSNIGNFFTELFSPESMGEEVNKPAAEAAETKDEPAPAEKQSEPAPAEKKQDEPAPLMKEQPAVPLTTEQELDEVTIMCRDVFGQKTADYGASWRIMRPSSVTDQIYIKANRIRSIEMKGETAVGEGIVPEFVAIVNYGLMGLIQLQLGHSETVDLDTDEVMRLYDEQLDKAMKLLAAKNHDYDEAWRLMRVSSYVDLILVKIQRTKQIENHNGKTLVSEGIDANYLDMVNYALFALIKLVCEADGKFTPKSARKSARKSSKKANTEA